MLKLLGWIAQGFMNGLALVFLLLLWLVFGGKFAAVALLVLLVGVALEYLWPSKKQRGG